MTFETERLILRDMTPDDFADLSAVLSDPETMKHYPAPYDETGVQRWINWTLSNYAKYGFGLWAVILKETDEFIGDCGITMQNINGKSLPEIGYHFNRRFWRKGYGSEAAAKCTELAFTRWNMPAVYSYMTDGNAASWGVAVKNGMTLLETYEDEIDGLLRVYRITREEWEASHRS